MHASFCNFFLQLHHCHFYEILIFTSVETVAFLLNSESTAMSCRFFQKSWCWVNFEYICSPFHNFVALFFIDIVSLVSLAHASHQRPNRQSRTLQGVSNQSILINALPNRFTWFSLWLSQIDSCSTQLQILNGSQKVTYTTLCKQSAECSWRFNDVLYKHT